MREKTKLLDNVQNFLESKKGYKKSWVRSFIVVFLAIICFAVVLGISYNLGPMSNKSFEIGRNYPTTLSLASNAYLLKQATYMSIAGLSLIGLPFVIALAVWMIGINQVTKSKYFHLFMWFTVFCISVLALISVIFLIRASIFNFDEFPKVETPSDGGSSGGETPPEQTYNLLLNIKNVIL